MATHFRACARPRMRGYRGAASRSSFMRVNPPHGPWPFSSPKLRAVSSLGRVLPVFVALVSTLLAEEPKLDARYPFRTDFANANLPWYQPKPLEFPPHHSDRRISGELVSVDFIHRTGQ